MYWNCMLVLISIIDTIICEEYEIFYGDIDMLLG